MRERICLDRGWRFALGHAANPALDFEFTRDRGLVKAGEARGAAGVKFDDSKWRTVDLPHDWAVELPFDPHGDKELCDHGFLSVGPDHPESSVAWYRRTFDVAKPDLGRRISIEFDGVFRDSIVWINGHRLGRHESGFTPFRYDVSDFLNYGGRNVMAVRVDATQYEGWWYDGAGIYRHVWLVKTDAVHVATDGTWIVSKLGKSTATVTVRTTIVNDGDEPAKIELISRTGVSPVLRKVVHLKPWSSTEASQQFDVRNPRLWSPEEPNLYQLRTTLKRGSKTTDEVATNFGIRALRWDARRGFFLNGKQYRIKGTCNHQDHAGVGVALPDRLQTLRIEKLKALGSNAYRCAHYPATPELLDACDRLGMLVMAENRLASSAPQFLDDFETMIRRDRNHPSIILWSIGNEEHTIQWSIAGERIGKTLLRRAHELDPTRKVTAAMHDRGLGEGFANIVNVHGWNYMKVGNIDAFHKRRPEQPIVGSEEGSTVTTRGIYADDEPRGYVSAYDVRAPNWGSTAESWVTFFAKRPWLAGGWVWTGFDHRGEPIPYKWPCTLSHFGLMDFCGFPKDNYYYYQSWWSDRPVLHLFPHWNWPGMEGREIDVRCFTNHERVELFLNGKSEGVRDVPRLSHAAWKVLYEPGTLEAIAYRSGRRVASTKVETTGVPARIALNADRSSILTDGADVAAVTVSAVDDRGRPVPTADNLIAFDVEGDGRLLGVGNGDPSSHESDKAPHRRLFSGMALVLLQSTPRGRSSGSTTLRATSPGLKPARMDIRTVR
jgi:beta-galactosidase